VTLAPAAIAFAADPVIQGNDKAAVDVTNIADGYVRITYKGAASAKVKVIIKTPKATEYKYNLKTVAEGEVFPLTEGDGKYTIGVYTNASGNKYAVSFTTTADVKLNNTYAPFLVPSQYVNFIPEGDKKSEVVKKAAEVTKDKKTDLEKITAVYNEVLKFTYDTPKAKTVESGYLPDVDKILSSQKGICFDYAAVMTAMLRSQKIPCQLVVGYVGEVCHAWINAYTKEEGWVKEVIQFDGKTWKLMDPTFASTGKESKDTMKYIGDGKNYSAKYYY
jgi:transglutaminase-like putative cysteine protease